MEKRAKRAWNILKNNDLDLHELSDVVRAYVIVASGTQDVDSDSLSGFVGYVNRYKGEA